MKSITIHNLDEQLSSSIEAVAKTKGLSLNKTIQSLLRDALGLHGKKKYRDLSEVSGTISAKEYAQLTKKLATFSHIDTEEW